MDTHAHNPLHDNELAKMASHATPFFERYGNHIAVGICVVSIIAAGFIYWTRSSYVKSAGAWMSLATSASPNELADVADRYKGTGAAGWAKLKEGDQRLENGIELMFSDREASIVELKKAKEAYSSLLSISDAAIRERAMYGYARTAESLSTGDLAEAIKAYEDLLKAFPNSVYKSDVEPHVKQLKTGGAQEFYAWFSKQNPKPAAPKKPSDKVGEDDAAGPSLPIPSLPGDTTAPEPPVLTPPAEEAKPEEKTPPTPEKPAEATPAESKPEESKPAEPKQEEEKPASPAEKPAEPAQEEPQPEAPKAEEPKADEPKSE